ncbi:hypothetical protein CEX98_01995 [Pseudoalteromonas piscicida]|uniref:Uncharacterized protein n=1 Tax=Pseudoalteromonas piscicida TaxID=43662 RepID=A0A2A5JVH1_PSEO7|nr:hypothetical protein CEX98_01995 [Pseudoalteromonas piscicida]
MLQKDFKFVKELADEFFNQTHIIERLDLIGKKEITGWEIWLQIEFAIFLDEHSDIARWDREYMYSVDRRKTKNKTLIAVDFTFRKKHSSTYRYIALEMKQNKSANSCIRAMMNDIHKLFIIKRSVDDIRSIWNLGVHLYVEPDVIYEKVRKYEKDLKVSLVDNCIVSDRIQDTHFAYTIF